jgi:hypothetical protein
MGLISTFINKGVDFHSDFNSIRWNFDKLMSLHMWLVKNSTWEEEKSHDLMLGFEEVWENHTTVEEQEKEFARWKNYIINGDKENFGVHKRGVFTISIDKLNELELKLRTLSMIYRSIWSCRNGKVAQKDFRKFVDAELPNYYLEHRSYGGKKINRESKEENYMWEVEEMHAFLSGFINEAEKANQNEVHYLALWN